MDITYGSKRKRGRNDYKPIYFPTLARLDERTGDGRLIEAEGFGVRDLPLTIFAQFQNFGGHDAAEVVGHLDAVRVAGNNVEGWGWAVDTPEGRKAAEGLEDGSLRGNSVDLAEAKVKVKIDWGDGDPFETDNEWFSPPEVFVNFTQARIGATTLVATPAFAAARAEIDDMSDDEELVASLTLTTVTFGAEEELTAGGMIKVPHGSFFIEETDKLCPLTVTDDGVVFGHLGSRTSCHEGILDRCVRIPYSASNYAFFNTQPVPTTEGRVRTGPIFLTGGHEATADYINKAMADTANVWADVRVIDGRLGPWISGHVRPGATPEQVYAGAASRVSGHWKKEGGDLELYAIASVNVPGFAVPAIEADFDEHGVSYLAASLLIPCEGEATTEPPAEESEMSEEDILLAMDLELALEGEGG